MPSQTPSRPSMQRAATLGVSQMTEQIAPTMARRATMTSSSSTWSETLATRTTPRITVATPHHKRTSSGADLADFPESDAADEILRLLPPRSKAYNRPRSHTNSLMMSIAEETSPLRLSCSFETVRGSDSISARQRQQQLHTQYPSLFNPNGSPDSVATDWHTFVSANYGHRQCLSATQDVLVHQANQGKADSPTLNDHESWLEAELAIYSSDEDSLPKTSNLPEVHLPADDDERFMTPQASPSLSLFDDQGIPSPHFDVGVNKDLLQTPQFGSSISAESLLEQMRMHEACLAVLHSLAGSEDIALSRETDSLTKRSADAPVVPLPPMPSRGSSLLAPSILQRRSSNGDFASTRSIDTSSDLFDPSEEAPTSYNPAHSPGADSGHCDNRSVGKWQKSRAHRVSATSFLSSSSRGSTAEGSISSHGSSLLFDGLQITVPRPAGPERADSEDTGYSTRPSSATSSSFYCGTGRRSSTASSMSYTALSPVRKVNGPAVATELVDQMPRVSERVLRQAQKRRLRKEGSNCEPLLPPARMGSLGSRTNSRAGSIQEAGMMGDWMLSPTETDRSACSSRQNSGKGKARATMSAATSITQSPPTAQIASSGRRGRKSIAASASQAAVDLQSKATRSPGDPALSFRAVSTAAPNRPRLSTRASADDAKELTPRSSRSFLRKLQEGMMSSSSLHSHKSDPLKHNASVRSADQSFFNWNDDDNDEPWMRQERPRGSGKKDLRKVFGASAQDLGLTFAA